MQGMENYSQDQNILEKFGRDIVEEVKKGKIDPVIGRDEEIRNITRILSRKTKNNPVLIGEAGVGKSAIIEGLASRIVQNTVPDILQNKIWKKGICSIGQLTWNSAAYVARYVVKNMNKFYMLPGISTKMVFIFSRFMPTSLLSKIAFMVQKRRIK